MLDLRLLAAQLGRAPVVGDFRDNAARADSEFAFDFVERRVSVLNRVVQKRGNERVRVIDAAQRREQVRHAERVVDVRRRLGVSAALRGVLACGKVGGAEKNRRG